MFKLDMKSQYGSFCNSFDNLDTDSAISKLNAALNLYEVKNDLSTVLFYMKKGEKLVFTCSDNRYNSAILTRF